MKNKNWIFIIGIIIIILIIIGAVAINNFQNKKEDTIKIGAIFPLTGSAAIDGESAFNGIKLAVKEINAKGGVNGETIEIVSEDDNGDDSKEAINAYQTLRLKGINLIIGPMYSPAGQALTPIVCEDKSLLIAPSIGIKGFTSDNCNYTFDLWPADYENSKLIGEYAVKLGYKKIAIIGSIQSWCLEQAEGVKEGVLSSNGDVVSYIITDDSNKDFLTEVAKINNAKPDAVIFTNYFSMSLVAKKLRDYGNKAMFFTVLLNNNDIGNAKGAFENSITISSFTPTDEFSKRFMNEYGTSIRFPADGAYDSMMILSKAINETKSTDPTKIQRYLHTLKTYEGASGNLTFNTYGGVIKESLFYIVKNETLIRYNP